MAYIDDEQWPFAVPYSERRIRQSADRLGSSYYGAKYLSDRWVALGSGQAAFDVMLEEMNVIAKSMAETNSFIIDAYRIWKAHESQGGVAPIPNTADIVNDGSPSANKAAISGAQCWTLITRIVEFLAWGDTGIFSAASQAVGSGGFWLYTIVDMTNEGRPGVVALADGAELINRCDELIADYEANSAVKLGSVLQVAVNVNRYGQ